MFTVGIDTGGTFTDAFVTGPDGAVATAKVETTPHDLTVCFADAVKASAAAVDLGITDFLRRAGVIRFSSTIATNTVLTRTGPKLGLVVTRGEEQDLYGASEDPVLFEFISRELVAGIDEAVAADGSVRRAPAADEVNQAVRRLLERGARILVVSLRNASASDANEQAVRRFVDESYPRHYLGAVPVLLSTQVRAVGSDASRTSAAVLDAYMHQRLATSLYRAEDDLRRSGFRRPLLVVNADGGVTRVAKTRALSTYQSGPTSGIYASALLCRDVGVENALTADVGGTSTDIGLVVDGRPVLRARVEVEGLEVSQPSVQLVSLGVGGGSLACVEEGEVSVGPESAGAAPGPACFGLGGRHPTPTDAWLALGYLDPDYYLGGRKKLDLDLARRALEEGIGRSLGLSAEEGALRVKAAAERTVADGVRALLERGRLAEETEGLRLGDMALVAYGGGGGLLLPAVAWRLGIGKVILPRLSPVFSAFGVSTFDIRHRYEARTALDGAGREQTIVAALVEAARRDMRGEGFDSSSIAFVLNVSDDEGRPLARELAPADLERAGLPRSLTVVLELEATCTVEKPRLAEEPERGRGAPPPKARRTILLESGPATVDVHSREALVPGKVLAGPTIIEASDTTHLVPEGVVCTVDRVGSAVLTEGG